MIITINTFDNASKPINLTNQKLKILQDNIKIVDYVTGHSLERFDHQHVDSLLNVNLNKENQAALHDAHPGWTYTDKKGKLCFDSDEFSNVNQIKYYIQCENVHDSKQLSVTVILNGVKYTTAKNGTNGFDSSIVLYSQTEENIDNSAIRFYAEAPDKLSLTEKVKYGWLAVEANISVSHTQYFLKSANPQAHKICLY
ncbi:hypothetical protein JZM24_09115 [Candidatus Sodalis endolongispinus]|uniref:Uncharacterized protein n=1 Tax=Candidatus Sodalis endolongispinus TaxID=2812662 RepID=A0ABS5YBD1_9GAMM|nr:hypothetical protein [Candidatus Sodalis endolongispinus]MBT9432243.1 hypothetical protein [Candidatus Sodalis endolongispinus]